MKISAAYRVSTLVPDYPDVVPLAQALSAANADRVVGGTDWPHPTGTPPGGKPTDVTPLLQIDDGRVGFGPRCNGLGRYLARGELSVM